MQNDIAYFVILGYGCITISRWDGIFLLWVRPPPGNLNRTERRLSFNTFYRHWDLMRHLPWCWQGQEQQWVIQGDHFTQNVIQHTHINEYTLHCKVILSTPWQKASGWHSVAGGGVWHLPPGTSLKWSSHTGHHAASQYWPPARLPQPWDGLQHYYYHCRYCIVIDILMSWERLSMLK